MKPAISGLVGKLHDILTPRQRRAAVLLFFLMLVGTILETIGIGLLIPTLALLVEPDIQARYPALAPILASLGNPSHTELVAGGMLVLFGVYAVKAAFLAFMAWRQVRFVYSVQASVSQRLFAGYLHLPWSFHLQRNSAQLVRNALSETAVFSTSGLMPGLMLMTEVFVVAGIALLLLAVEPIGAVVVCASIGAAGWGFQAVTRSRIGTWGLARQHHEGLRLKHLHQGLGGAKEVKLLGREGEFLDQYRVHNEASAKFQQRQNTLLHMPRLWFELLAVLGLAILVLVMLIQQKAPAAVLPTLGLFAAAAFRLLPSMNRILNALQNVNYALPAIDTLHEEFQIIESEQVPEPGDLLPFDRVLELKRVSFSYEGSAAPALEDVDLRVPRGATIGFVGGSGAGKTTLVDVILGLLPPQRGSVRVDGTDVRGNLRGWQDQIGYVPQTVFLNDDTLRRNVAFGLPENDIDDAAVRRALEAAQLQALVAELPRGMDTIVGERGVRLSGGQRQRIGIARALYHDPAVLVLDEATSSLDTATEEGVMRAIRALHGEKTILIVAHRVSTVADCDHLYRLEGGRVVDEGRTVDVLGRISSDSAVSGEALHRVAAAGGET